MPNIQDGQVLPIFPKIAKAMNELSIRQSNAPSLSASEPTGPAVRVDAAHSASLPRAAEVIGRENASPGDTPVADTPTTATPEQIRLQASQLAARLRRKQAELDRREAQMNARQSQLDRDATAARLLLQEREHALAHRETEARQRLQDAEQRIAQLAAVELSTDQDLTSQRNRLAAWQQELDAREGEVAATREGLRRQADELATREREQTTQHNQERQRLAEETDRLRQIEQLLNKHVAQAAAERQSLAAEREQFTAQVEQQQLALAKRKLQVDELSLRQKQLIDERNASLDSREQAVEQLRDEASRMHCQALEMRLVSEQLWSQLSEGLTPVELTQSLGRIRGKLADYYRAENETLAEQTRELQAWDERLDEKKRLLVEQRDELQRWFVRRQEEVEEQAARLVAREQELNRQQRSHELAQRHWEQERTDYQRQIRDLLRPQWSAAPAA